MGERTQRVVSRGAYLASFAGALAGLSCAGGDITPPPTSGRLTITTSTTGPEPDTDGYAVTLDGGTQAAIPVSGTLQRDDVEPGTHSIQLTGISANCTAAGLNPRSINVPAGETVTVAFELTCSATTGSLQITSATSGVSPDADGYGITLDGADRGTLVSSGAVTLNGLPPGTHSVGLSGVAGNCLVQGDNPRPIAILAGASATIAFQVVCGEPPPVTGSLQVTTSTTGPDPDPDGYSFAIDDGAAQSIESNASVTISNVAAGAHEVRLSGMAENCNVGGTNPRSATVVAGATAEVSFAVTCAVATRSLIAFTSVESDQPFVFVVKPDGTGLTKLAAGSAPVWSPDKRKLLFQRDDNLYVMNADGSGQMQLAEVRSDDPEEGSGIDSYRWSPDGRTVAFASWACDAGHCIQFGGLSVVRADGSGEIALTGFAWAPSWSPDGRRIAYMWDIPGQAESKIRVINADGSGDTELQNTSWASNPDWSPDGSRIVFTQGLAQTDVFLMKPDGTGLVNLGIPGSDDFSPRWSPDGMRIVFTTGDLLASMAVAVMNRDGSGQRKLTRSHYDSDPDWSPDGSQIAFSRRSGDFNSDVFDVFVVNADGSGETRVSSGPHSSEPDW
jgi:Tol biopolymer transport system component